MGKDWNAVAEAINTRLAELGMTQAELASKSRVSPATLRQMQHGVAKRRTPHTLAAISEALGWPSRHLEQVSEGESVAPDPDRVARLENALADLEQRVRRIEDASAS
ncbi:helix-turn-helix domain-containing protein [Saccharomonospora halophila]|uniref:helix-turn-helix domain-containing protein n=1 Tax=Saccharomonospora halophila TaxID=129922 RepID=UPI00036496FB|nr:helix-turn-helix transcriptional regulator [Saccharomonospora halophila]